MIDWAAAPYVVGSSRHFTAQLMPDLGGLKLKMLFIFV